MFFIIFISSMLATVILILYNAWLSDWALNTPSFPMTKVEAKCMDIKSRLQEIKYRNIQREVQSNYNDTRIHAGGVTFRD